MNADPPVLPPSRPPPSANKAIQHPRASDLVKSPDSAQRVTPKSDTTISGFMGLCEHLKVDRQVNLDTFESCGNYDSASHNERPNWTISKMLKISDGMVRAARKERS
ncbi:hypothetical protein FPOAC2_05730 [Fusarium poae]